MKRDGQFVQLLKGVSGVSLCSLQHLCCNITPSYCTPLLASWKVVITCHLTDLFLWCCNGHHGCSWMLMDVHGCSSESWEQPWLFALLFGLFRRLLEIPEALQVADRRQNGTTPEMNLRQVHACQCNVFQCISYYFWLIQMRRRVYIILSRHL